MTECGLDQGDDGTNARRELGIYLVKFLTTLLSVAYSAPTGIWRGDWGSYHTGCCMTSSSRAAELRANGGLRRLRGAEQTSLRRTYVGRDATSDRRNYSHHFRSPDGSDFRVLYSTRPGPSSVTVRSSQSLQVLNYMGSAAGSAASTPQAGRRESRTEPIAESGHLHAGVDR